MRFLKNHPFPVQAHFIQSDVLTFAFPKEELEAFIPTKLTLDTFDDQWAFLAIAMVQTKHLRPKGFPKFLGQDFFLIGYRIFVRYTNQQGKNLRGLYILKSETNKKQMEYLGNVFTQYAYTTTDIQILRNGTSKSIESQKSKFQVVLNDQEETTNLPEDSPFNSWKEARRFAGPLPHTFSVNQDKSVLTVRGIRQNWTPKPMEVLQYNFQFLDQLNASKPTLASAFKISDIPYSWEKGILEQW